MPTEDPRSLVRSCAIECVLLLFWRPLFLVLAIGLSSSVVQGQILLSEDFEEIDSGGELGSASDGYDSPLVSAEYSGGGSIYPDSPAPSSGWGAQVMRVVGVDGDDTYVEWDLGAEHAELWVYFRLAAKGTSYNRSIFRFVDGTGSTCLNGAIVDAVRQLSIGADKTVPIAAGSHVWVHYQRNGVKEVFTSADGVRPGAGTNYAVGSAGSRAVQKLRFGIFNKSNTWGYDKILVSQNEIGNDPWNLPQNQPPEVTVELLQLTEDDVAVQSGNLLSTATDPEGDTLSLVAVNGDQSLVGQPISGIHGVFTAASDGAFTYQLSERLDWLAASQVDSTETFLATVSDGNGNEVDVNLPVEIAGLNDAPILEEDLLLEVTAYEGASFAHVFDISAFSDPEGDDITLQLLSELPPGFNYDEASVTLSTSGQAVSAAAAEQSNYALSVYAYDGVASSISDSFTLTIVPLVIPADEPVLLGSAVAVEGSRIDLSNGDLLISNLEAAPIRFSTSGAERLSVGSNGGVVIESADDDSSALDVKGEIRAAKVVVEADWWADFVFEDGYDLLSIEELDAYIQANGQLPGVPSAKEVLDNGISLGESQAILLQKIEELTLYVIELERKLKNVTEARANEK